MKTSCALLAAGLLLVVWAHGGRAQEGQQEKPCSSAEARQFDFWLGSWSLSWTDKDGNELHGSNSIASILGGCVIQEQFDDPVTGFSGMSVSTYSAPTGKWHQTWVDNNGSYLDFAGEFRDGKMILQRTAAKEGSTFLQRMVWYNISHNELDWNWERSNDNGKTWNLLWKIHYTRSK